MKIFKIFILMTILLLITQGCNSEEIIGNDYDILGTITEVQMNDSNVPTAILVESASDENIYDYDKAYVSITKSTIIKDSENGDDLPFDIINLGMTVKVKFDGPVAESYPVQTDAGKILIIKY